MDPMSIFGIIIFAIFSLIAISGSALAFNDKACGVGLFLLVMGLLFLFMFGGQIYCEGDKQGQINAANGKQKYHLTTQPDNTSKWELKEKK